MRAYNFREYIDLSDYKQEEIQGFIDKVENFASGILPHMDEHMKAVLDITTLVGRGITATLCIYGYNEIYDDQFDFEKVNTEQSMEKQVGGIIKSSIGNYDYISASTFWTAKKRFGKGRSIETGPYVEVEFNEETIYNMLGESVQKLTDRILEGKSVRSVIKDNSNIITEAVNYETVDDIMSSTVLKNFFESPDSVRVFYNFMKEWDKANKDFYANHYSNLEVPEHKYSVGKSYIKVVSRGAVDAFIDKYGNLYKPAGWNAPAKGVRYYIDDYNKINFDPHGSFLYGNRNLVPKEGADLTESKEELVDVYAYIDRLKKWELLYSQIPEKVASDIWSAGFKTGKNKISIQTEIDREIKKDNMIRMGIR